MKKMVRKLLLGNNSSAAQPEFNPLEKRIQNIKSIWNNDHQDDNGIEKLVRLFLSSSQLLFPGIYIKYFAFKKGVRYEDLAVDCYVLLKVFYPLFLLSNGLQSNPFLMGILVYVLLETVFYIPTLIFASDLLAKPRSYKRSMLLLFLNYIEIVFAYAALYSYGNYMNKQFIHWFDAIYFSIVTSSSIGYGDLYPITVEGKFLVSTQALLFLLFVVLFLNFFSTKIKSKGYFEQDAED